MRRFLATGQLENASGISELNLLANSIAFIYRPLVK